MEKSSMDDMLGYAIVLLKFIGEDKHHASKPLLLYRFINCTVLILLGIFTAINFLYATTEAYVKTLQALLAMLHVLLKYLMLIQNKFRIESLISDTTAFWSYENFDGDIRVQTRKIIQAVMNLQKLMLIVSCIIVIIYFLRPVLDVNYVYLLEIWIPKSYAIDAFLQLSQYYYMVVAFPIVFSYDFVYFVLCIHVVIQMKLLKIKIKNTLDGYDECTIQMDKCVKYYQFLQNMFSKMKNIYSLLLLFHYFMTLISACSELYELLVKNAALSALILKFLSTIFFFGQFAYYTFPAEQIAFEFSDLAAVIYSSKWYNHSKNVKQAVLFTMVRSQRVEYFTGAGLIDINVYTFGSVFRKVFSFYAVLANLLNK